MFSKIRFFFIITIILMVKDLKSQPWKLIYYQGNEAYQNENYLEAIRYFTASLDLNPEYNIARLHRAYSYINLQQYKEAKKDIKKSFLYDDSCADCYEVYGYYLNELGKYKKAIEAFNTSLTFNPNNAKVYVNIGYANEFLNKFSMAIKNYRKAISIDSTLAYAHNNLGAARFYNQDYENPSSVDIRLAIQSFSEAIKHDSNFCYPYQNRAFAYEFIGQFDSAYTDFLKATNCDNGKNVVWKLGMAENLNRLKKYDLALDIVSQIKKEDYFYPFALIYGGFAHLGLGNEDLAEEAFSKINKRYKSFRAIAFYNKAIFYASEINKVEAIKNLWLASKYGYFSHNFYYRRLKKDKIFEPFRKDADFVALEKKIFKKNKRKLTRNTKFIDVFK